MRSWGKSDYFGIASKKFENDYRKLKCIVLIVFTMYAVDYGDSRHASRTQTSV